MYGSNKNKRFDISRIIILLFLGCFLSACKVSIPDDTDKPPIDKPPIVKPPVVKPPIDKPPYVLNPIENISANSAKKVEVDLSGVFDDVDNDNSKIIFSATSSNTSLVKISLNKARLTLNLQPNKFGTSKIVVTASSNGSKITEKFLVTLLESTSGKAKVFLMAGQSNMVGHGRTSELASIDLALTKSRDDVFIKSIISPIRSLDKLQPGYGYNRKIFGVELKFGHVMGDNFDVPIYLFKASIGGTTIEDVNDWRPPQHGGRSNNLYKKMLNGFNQFIETELEAKGIDYEIAGFIWFQGFNDAAEGHQDTYETNIRNLLSAVRSDLNLPQLPVVITQINDTLGARGEVVRNAQRKVANESAKNALVVTGDQRPYFHYGSRSYVTIGDRIAHKALSLLKVPVAEDDTYTAKPGRRLSIGLDSGVMRNDSTESLQALLVSSVTHGQLNFHADGSFDYQPEDGFVGEDSFQYRTLSSSKLSNTSQVTLRVRNPEDSLVVHFDFDGKNPLKDKASGIVARIKHEGVSFVAQGKRGRAAHFNGKGVLHYAEDYPIKDYLNLSTNRNFSLLAWVKSDSAQSQEQIFFSNKWEYNRAPGWTVTTGGATNTVKAYLSTYDHESFSNSAVKLSAPQGGGLNDGGWHHVALTADFTRNKMSLYFDGVLTHEVDTHRLKGEFNRNESAIGDGANGGNSQSNGFIGTIDEFKIFTRALSADEILSLN